MIFNKRIKKSKIFKSRSKEYDLKKIKLQGLPLLIGDKIVNIKLTNEVFNRYLPKPTLNVFMEDDTKIGISFVIKTDADRAFLDIKEINRYSSTWKNIITIDDVKKEKENVFYYDFSKGQCIKIRITYYKDSSYEFEEVVFQDPTYRFFYDPPEIKMHQRNDIKLSVFNINRFVPEGHVRLFRKENEEIEECIGSIPITESIISFFDKKIYGENFYEYRAEVYDNQGNIYNTSKVSTLYKRKINIENIEIQYDEQKDLYYFTNIEETKKYKIEYIDIEREICHLIKYKFEKDGNIYFSINRLYKTYENIEYYDFMIQIEGYDINENLTSYGEIVEENKREAKIINEKIIKNSRSEAVISWDYTGNIDNFVVVSSSRIRNQIVKTVPHRISPEGYLYCIDSNYSNERVSTEYFINALDEFGKIIDRKRLTL